jgi:hypothetical protein
MSKSLEIFFLQKTILLLDIVRLIMSIFIRLQKFEPGQILFNSPCGHLLRIVEGSWFDEEKTYHKETKPWTSTDLVESGSEFQSQISCDECERYWCDTYSHETDLKLKIMCFCGKIDCTFPCETCLSKKCSIYDCVQLSDRTSSPLLCSDHYQCKICEHPFTYQYTKISSDMDGYIECTCQTCKNMYEYYDYDIELFYKLCQ